MSTSCFDAISTQCVQLFYILVTGTLPVGVIVLSQCEQYLQMDAVSISPVPEGSSTFFVLLCQSTQNVAAVLDFSRNPGRRLGDTQMSDASMPSDWYRVAAMCRAWCRRARNVQQAVGQSASMATMGADIEYPLMGGDSCVL
jgi:hypothetical protein